MTQITSLWTQKYNFKVDGPKQQMDLWCILLKKQQHNHAQSTATNATSDTNEGAQHLIPGTDATAGKATYKHSNEMGWCTSVNTPIQAAGFIQP